MSTVGSPSPCFFSRSGGAVYAAESRKPPSANATIGQPRATVSTIMIARQIKLTTSAHAGEALAGDHARQHRVRRVQVAGVVLAVGADAQVEEVVHQVVGHVGADDPDQGEGEPAPRDVVAPVDREQSGDRPGHQGHGENPGPGQVQPLRNRVQAPFGGIRGGEDVLPVVKKATSWTFGQIFG